MTTEAKVLIGIALASILIVVGGALIVGNTTPKEEVVIDKKILVRSNSNVEGSGSAQVTLVEFADFQCPACAAWFPTVNQVKSKYAKKIRYAFRHFPLDIHKNAQLAAYASEAAGKQGKFWEMHDILYENQSEWSESSSPKELFIQYATDLKLDREKFEKDLEDTKVKEKVKQDISDGYKAQVNSTPTFFLNGKKLEIRTPEELTFEIDAILTQ